MGQTYLISDLVNLAEFQHLIEYAWKEWAIPIRLENLQGVLLTSPCPGGAGQKLLPAWLDPARTNQPTCAVPLEIRGLAGVYTAVYPVIVGGTRMATLVAGEYTVLDAEPDEAELEKLSRWNHITAAECRTRIDQLARLPQARIELFLNHFCWQVRFITSFAEQSLKQQQQMEELNRTTLALTNLERHYRGIFNGIQDAVLVETQDGRILDANEPACQLYGYSHPELLRTQIRDLVPPGAEIITLENHTTLSAPIETLNMRKDRSIFPVELSGRAWEVDGQAALLVVIRDISARRQVENEVRRSQERLELALEATDAGLWDWDIASGQHYLSPPWYTQLGYQPGKLPSAFESWQALIHPEDSPRVNSLLEQHLAGRRPVYEAKYRLRAQDGSWRWILSRGRIIEYSPSGKPQRMAGTHIDITLHQAAETALRDSEEKFYHSFQTSSDAIHISRRSDAVLLDINAGFLHMTGYSHEEALGKTAYELNIWAYPEEYRQVLRELAEKGEVLGSEATFRRKDGSFVSGLVAARLIELDGTECILNIIRDVSDRKQAEDLLREAHLRLEWAYEATLLGWNRALEMRDFATKRHSERCIDLTVQLAEAAGISGEELTFVKYGAILHDIGKLAIPDSILNKPASFTEAEWLLMRRHPLYAQEMLQGIEYLQPVLALVTSHHERWDGSGYPLGLQGTEIPLTARIFAIVDVWDSIIHPRVWRPALGEPEARRYLHENTGRHFDPELVTLFFKIVGDSNLSSVQ